MFKRSILAGCLIGGLAFGLWVPLSLADSDYTDVYDSHPVKEALDYLTDEGIVEGYSDGRFGTLDLINRAEFTKMIVAGLLEPNPDADEYRDCFEDVADQWYARYICYAAEKGIVEGYGDDFQPKAQITKAEAVKIIVSVLDWDHDLPHSQYFNDLTLDKWYTDYFLAAEAQGVFDTLDYHISPHELLSRSQMATLLYRALMVEEGEGFEVFELEYKSEKSYQEILDMGLEPAFPGDMDFSAHSQSAYPYGCYAFATKNLLEWKYDWFLDIPEVQETIGWDGTFIWSPAEFSTFADEYEVDVIFTYQGSAEFFFKKLASGEPMVLYIPYYLDDINIGHNLVDYSFAADGVWVDDSLSGGLQRHISYEEVFLDNAHYTTNLTQLRKLKNNGSRKDQVGR